MTTVATTEFEPLRKLHELAAASDGAAKHPMPDRLPLMEIEVHPELFQPRGISERHIGDLVRAIKAQGEVDPVTIFAAGRRSILIDGHHRLQAYQRVGSGKSIPVTYFTGTPEQAVLVAGQSNSKAKLPMSNHERQDFAWRLVLLDTHSKTEIVRASGVATSQVGNMRAVRKKLGDNAFGYPSWFLARHAASGPETDMTDDERDQWADELADRWADRLAQHFSTTMADRPGVAAMALSRYFGRRLPEVVNELRSFVAEEEPDNDDF